MMKRIVLCADDYGQAPTISAAILALVKLRRLSAVSCLVNREDWIEHGPLLRQHHSLVSIGLHLNFTEGQPLSGIYRRYYGDHFFSVGKLLLQAGLKRLNNEALQAEIMAQVASFQQVTGFLPDFLDGHQHVHQFPCIREALISVYQKWFPHYKTPIRLVQPKIDVTRPLNDIKKIVILASGLFFKNLLIKQGIPYNRHFSGIYNFNQPHYRQIFLHALGEISEEGLIMCHPGFSPLGKTADKIAASRSEEYAYLTSPLFLSDCLTYKIELIRF